jgi:hypothetical protein
MEPAVTPRDLLDAGTRAGLLLPAARTLTDRGDLAAGLLAARLTVLAGESSDWPEPWLDQLTRLRTSAHAEVRQAAWPDSNGQAYVRARRRR